VHRDPVGFDVLLVNGRGLSRHPRLAGQGIPRSRLPLRALVDRRRLRYMPACSPVPPEIAYEPVEVFSKRAAPPPAPRKELVVVRRALEENAASVVVASLRSQGVAKRLRKAPAVRLLLDRASMVRPWGRASTGVGGARN
jgi:hypothetical protein